MAKSPSRASSVRRERVKYIFIDIVGFSKRKAEAQSDIVEGMNSVVQACLEEARISSESRILLPTGDGMCIALIDNGFQFDIHVQLARAILKKLAEFNRSARESRRFKLRVGINQNTDIRVTDINGNENLAGAGINIAARIMDKADGGQILIGQAVHHELSPSEEYSNCFREWRMVDKHGSAHTVYQMTGPKTKGLDAGIPSAFATDLEVVPSIPEIMALYLVTAIRFQEEFLTLPKLATREYIITVLYGLLATDSYNEKQRPAYETPSYLTHKFVGGTLAEQFDYYSKVDTWILYAARDALIAGSYLHSQLMLRPFSLYFENTSGGRNFAFVNRLGRIMLKEEWPDLYSSIQPDESSPSPTDLQT